LDPRSVSPFLVPGLRPSMGGKALRFSPLFFTPIFRLFQNFGEKRFPLLIYAYCSVYFLFFVQICTKNLRDMCFPPEFFQFFPHEKMLSGMLFIRDPSQRRFGSLAVGVGIASPPPPPLRRFRPLSAERGPRTQSSSGRQGLS